MTILQELLIEFHELLYARTIISEFTIISKYYFYTAWLYNSMINSKTYYVTTIIKQNNYPINNLHDDTWTGEQYAPASRIYINDHLLPENKQLLGKLKQKCRDIGYTFTLCHDGQF